MRQVGIKEYAETVRERYFLASKKEKSKILDELTKVTGCLERRPFGYSTGETTPKQAGSVGDLGNMALRRKWCTKDGLGTL